MEKQEKTKTVESLDIEMSSISLSEKINAFFRGNEVVVGYSKEVMLPMLKGLLELNDKEKAIVGTYYRMHALMCSLITLNKIVHFQTAASITRSLFELIIDLKIICTDKTGEIIKKFHNFSKVERFRAANIAFNFKEKNKDSNINITHQEELLNKSNKRKEIDKIIENNWGFTKKGNLNYPKNHWTGLDVHSRIKHYKLGLEYEEIYIELYSILSWYIHSGSVGYVGIDKEAIEAIFGLCHSKSQKLFLEGIQNSVEELKISKAIDGFKAMLDKLEIEMGKYFIEKNIQIK